MQRLTVLAALLLPFAFAQAQTTIKITNPDLSTCTYPTGQVSSNATPGQLQATATAPGSGTGCGSNAPAASFGPAFPLAPSAVTIASAVGGETTGLTFQAVNATTCTGSIAGGGIFTGGGSTITFCSPGNGNCSNPQGVSLTLPENTSTATDAQYTVSATCTGAGGATVPPSSALVTVSKKIIGGCQPPQNCGCAKTIATSIGGTVAALNGTVTMTYSGHNPQSGTDITSFDSIYQGAWPGSYNLIAIYSLNKANYISARFKPPATYFNATNVPDLLYGDYSVAETFSW